MALYLVVLSNYPTYRPARARFTPHIVASGVYATLQKMFLPSPKRRALMRAMGKLKDIDEAITEKRAHIMRLNNEVQLLERARALLNGGAAPRTAAPPKEEATKRLVRRVGSKPGFHRVRRVSRPHPKRGAVSPTSDVGRAIAALKEAGVPLHVS